MTAGAIATWIIASVLAAEPESLKVSLNDYACMTEAIYFEAEGESLAGKRAVANVILNRAKSKRFPNSICAVVKQHRQFSYRNGAKPVIKLENKIEEKAFRDAAIIAFQAVNGHLHDNTGGANHYYNPDKANPSWADSAEWERSIGNHLFAKL